MKNVTSSKSVKNKIVFVYFTCDRHFEYLLLSLKSLKRISSAMIGTAYLYIDEDNFLSSEHLNELKKIRMNIKIKKCEKLSGWGKRMVMTELSAFKEIREELSSDDYVAKVDSDVLFISDDIFRYVLNSNLDMIGKEETFWSPFTYAQGGCYFLRASLIPKLLDFDESIFSEVLNTINDIAKSKNRAARELPEDATIFSIAKSKTDRISLKDYYGVSNARNASNVSVIHFQRDDKIFMAIYFRYGYRGVLLRQKLSSLRRRCEDSLKAIFKS